MVALMVPLANVSWVVETRRRYVGHRGAQLLANSSRLGSCWRLFRLAQDAPVDDDGAKHG
jgi:hypothetical protein